MVSENYELNPHRKRAAGERAKQKARADFDKCRDGDDGFIYTLAEKK